MSDIDVTSVGDINVDVITSCIRDFPERDSQAIIDDLHLSVGGCSANFARQTSILGMKTRFIGKLGDDLFADFIRRELVDVDLVVGKAAKTGVTYAVTFSDDTRSFITYPGANGELSIDDIDLEFIEGDYLHIASFFLQGLRGETGKLMDYAHERGMFVSFDTGWDPGGWSSEDLSLVKKILRKVDVFFPNLKEGAAITGMVGGEDVCGSLLDMGPEIVALKMGSEGSMIAGEKETLFIPSFRLDSVDTTGAGDVFNAAFVFGHSRGWDLMRSGRFANAAAALSTTGYGNDAYPGVDRVDELIKEVEVI